MSSNLREMVETGDPLVQQAIDAMRKYHEAEAAGVSAGEVERLRVLAESLFQAVNDYQLRALGGSTSIPH